MRVTLVHNPTAGSGRPSADEIVAALEGAGHEVAYQSTKDDGLDGAVQEAGDAIVAAGGDGTVRRVALRATRDVPVALLPLGTANNLARTLGTVEGVAACLHRLAAGRRHAVDLGRSAGDIGEHAFIEGCGFGLVPELIRVVEKYGQDEHHSDPQAELRHARSVLASLVPVLPAFNCTIRMDDETVTRRLIMLEVMNAQRIGPSLPVAPDADPSDGRLDVVWVEERNRDLLQEAVSAWTAGDAADWCCGTAAAAAVDIRCDAGMAHIDDEVWRPSGDQVRSGYELRLTCESGAFTILR